MRICKSGDLPVAGTETWFLGHEELAVPIEMEIFSFCFYVTFCLRTKGLSFSCIFCRKKKIAQAAWRHVPVI